MKLEDAEDLFLACLLQAPKYLDHSLVGDEQLSPRASRIVSQIRTIRDEGWPQITPEQLRVSHDDMRTIARRYEVVAAAETVKEAERQLIDAWGKKEIAHAYKVASTMVADYGPEKAEAHIAEKRRKIQAFGGRLNWSTSHEVAEDWLDERERIIRGEGPPPVLTGFDELDKAVRGYQPECLTVLGGYTNDGKSTAGGQLLTGMALRQTPVCYISLEDRKQIPVKRQLQQLLQDPGLASVISNDEMRLEHIERLRQEIRQDWFRSLPFHLEHRPGWSPEQCGYALQDAARNYGCRVGMVDYLQCFRGRGDRRIGLGDAAATLKTAACEVGMHLIIVSQIVRPQSRDRSDTRPNMFMLKESGDIENIAEYIVFVWRPNRGDDVPVEEALWILDKSKDSSQVEIVMGWDTTRNAFTRDAPTLPTGGGF